MLIDWIGRSLFQRCFRFNLCDFLRGDFHGWCANSLGTSQLQNRLEARKQMKAISLNQSIRFDSDISILATVWAAGSNWTGFNLDFQEIRVCFPVCPKYRGYWRMLEQLDFCRKLGLRKPWTVKSIQDFRGVKNDTEAAKFGNDLIAFIIIETCLNSKIHEWKF